jgi:hypothetical protein
MPRTDVLDRLHAEDPLRTIDAPPGDRDALLAAILATPAERVRVRSRGRRGLVIVLALVALLVGASAASTVALGLLDADDAQRELVDVRAGLPLPPGATWPDTTFDTSSVYGRQAGRMTALFQATCLWEREWDGAFRAGDAARQAAAVDALRGVVAQIPLHREGQSEDAGGMDQAGIDRYEALVAAAAAGDPGLLREDVRANCG